MEIPVLDKCCFIFSLRTGCIVLGIINPILSFTLAMVLITVAVDIKAVEGVRRGAEEVTKGGMSSVVYFILLMIVIVLLLKFFFDMVFVFAVYKRKNSIIKKYCIFCIVAMMLHIFGFLKAMFHIPAGHIITQILFFAENFYFIEIIRSYLISINEGSVL